MLLQPLSNEQFTTECFTISRLFRIFQISKRGYYLMLLSFQIISHFFQKKFLSSQGFRKFQFTPGELLKSTPTLLKVVELTLI